MEETMVKATLQGNSVVTTQGQITIPKGLRKRSCIKTGDIIEFLITENGLIVLRKMESKTEVDL